MSDAPVSRDTWEPKRAVEAFRSGWETGRGSLAPTVAAAALQSVVARLPPDRRDAPEASFWAELARCLPPGTTATNLQDAVGRIHVADLWLAVAARMGDPPAIKRFEVEILMPSARTLGRMNVLAPFRDEVLQRVRVKLLVGTRGEGPRLVHYRGRGDLSTWVTVVVVREALTMMRAAGRDRVDDAELLLLEATSAGPELATIHAEHRAALVQALRSAIDDLMPEQRNLLRLHHLHGASIDRIGAMLGLHRSSAARRLEKIRRLLLDRTRQRLSEMLRVDPNELDAIMGRVDSKLDLSLERLLL